MVIESVDGGLFALCPAAAARAIDRSSPSVSMPSLPVPRLSRHLKSTPDLCQYDDGIALQVLLIYRMRSRCAVKIKSDFDLRFSEANPFHEARYAGYLAFI